MKFSAWGLETIVLIGLFCLAGCDRKSDEQAPEILAQPEPEKPNIVIILADDLGYSDLSLYGSEIPTPNLDSLAREGMVLTNFYANMTCSPTRSMLMSGTDSHLAGLGIMTPPTRPEHMNQPGYLGYLNFEVLSLADLLADAGYDTYITGKWHLGMEVENGPVARGFKRAFTSLDGAAHLGPWDWRGPQNANYRDGEALVQVDADFYSTRVYTERMIEYIEEDRADGKPFFAYFAYTAPHWPLQAPEESMARFRGQYDAGYEQVYLDRFANLKALGFVPEDAEPMDLEVFSPRWADQSDEDKALASRRMEIYAAMVSDLDSYVGQFIDYLKSIGEYDNTFILFFADNGAEADRRDLQTPIVEHVGVEYDHSLENLGHWNSYVMYGPNWATVSAAPFRRHKFTGFEGGIHVPAFVHDPGVIPSGTRNDAYLTVMDVLPTLAELAGAEIPVGSYRGRAILPVQGESFLPVITGQADAIHTPDETNGWELYGHRSIRHGDWKIVWDAQEGADAQWQLFNVADDFGERHDLAEQEPEKLAEMIELWDRYAEENNVIYVTSP
jgi:arylsulfatase A-like enzyme